MRQILRHAYLSVIGSIKKPKQGIHILNAHYITPYETSSKEIFQNYIEYLLTIGRLIRFEDAVARINTFNIPNDELLIALTYDDGYEECYTYIAPILESYGCNAGFFISSNYIESDNSYQSSFNKRTEVNTKKPMNWSQVNDLHKRGHIIGSHTLDHYNLVKCSREEANQQLRKNKYALEERLNYKCEYFSWPYGQSRHFNKKLLLLAKTYHKYVFSACDYKNYFSYNNQVINRRHIECYWPSAHINYFMSTHKIYNKDISHEYFAD